MPVPGSHLQDRRSLQAVHLLRARRARQRDKEREDSQGDVARRVKESARGLDMEAQRLEALIAEKERGTRGRR